MDVAVSSVAALNTSKQIIGEGVKHSHVRVWDDGLRGGTQRFLTYESHLELWYLRMEYAILYLWETPLFVFPTSLGRIGMSLCQDVC